MRIGRLNISTESAVDRINRDPKSIMDPRFDVYYSDYRDWVPPTVSLGSLNLSIEAPAPGAERASCVVATAAFISGVVSTHLIRRSLHR